MKCTEEQNCSRPAIKCISRREATDGWYAWCEVERELKYDRSYLTDRELKIPIRADVVVRALYTSWRNSRGRRIHVERFARIRAGGHDPLRMAMAMALWSRLRVPQRASTHRESDSFTPISAAKRMTSVGRGRSRQTAIKDRGEECCARSGVLEADRPPAGG